MRIRHDNIRVIGQFHEVQRIIVIIAGIINDNGRVPGRQRLDNLPTIVVMVFLNSLIIIRPGWNA